MNFIELIDLGPKDSACSADLQDCAIDALEGGKILFLPRYRFVVTKDSKSIYEC
jgi:hypothetical protein